MGHNKHHKKHQRKSNYRNSFPYRTFLEKTAKYRKEFIAMGFVLIFFSSINTTGYDFQASVLQDSSGEVVNEVVNKLDHTSPEYKFQNGIIPFLDVADESLFDFKHLLKLRKRGVIRGTSTSGGRHFERDREINLAESAAMLARAFKLEDEVTARPTEVRAAAPRWATMELSLLAGIDQRYVHDDERDFGEVAERGELFVLAVDVLKAANAELPKVRCMNGHPFKDIYCEHPAATEALTLVELGILQGFRDNTVRLDVPINRAQAATIVSRLLDITESDE
jgi:hypothetical protein